MSEEVITIEEAYELLIENQLLPNEIARSDDWREFVSQIKEINKNLLISYDSECIDGNSSYEYVLDHYLDVIKDELNITDITSFLNRNNSTAGIKFNIKGNVITKEWKQEIDYVESEFVELIKEVIEPHLMGEFVNFPVEDQCCSQIYLPKRISSDIEKLFFNITSDMYGVFFDRIESSNDIKTYSGLFDDNEREILKYSPFTVFVLIAGPDGNFNPMDTENFSNALLKVKNPLMLELLKSNKDPVEEILSNLVENIMQAPLLLQNVDEIIESKLPDHEASIFREELLNLGKAIVLSIDPTEDDRSKLELRKTSFSFIAKIFNFDL